MTQALEGFRADVREWLEANCPSSMRTPMPPDEYPGGGRRAEFANPDTKLWLERMAERGFTVPAWPEEYGGAGLDSRRKPRPQEELRRINARPALLGMGISMIGPALLEFGNDEQKAEHLPKIARGEIWWCQGYSEPNAGSDLASLRTGRWRMATITSSTARRSGPPARTRRTGCSAWCAPIPRRRSMRASPSFCST
jgi:alkylation response protein AidB-like acyl-CoA dehydrogenase